jgi:hypothetical protein
LWHAFSDPGHDALDPGTETTPDHHIKALELTQARLQELEYRVTIDLSLIRRQLGDHTKAMTYALSSLHLVHGLTDLTSRWTGKPRRSQQTRTPVR